MSMANEAGLDEARLDAAPFALFREWLAEAERAALPEFNAMTLATASIDGRPSARMVLLRGFDARGFAFYTNYLSRKGGELGVNPFASLVFFWAPLFRQIRVEGSVVKVAITESDAYFASRPKGHQLGALVAQQSQVVKDRAQLEQRMEELEKIYPEGEIVPRPEHWGGFRVEPSSVEFWQGRENRLHDRICYTRQPGDRWNRQRLAP